MRNGTNGSGIPRITAWIGLALSILMIVLAATALAGCRVHDACRHPASCYVHTQPVEENP